MSFFDNDPFDDIVREFFGENPGRRRREKAVREDEDRTVDFIEDDERVYVIFELLGFDEEDIEISVNGKDIQLKAKKENGEKIMDYLTQRLHQGVIMRKTLPNSINTKRFSHTMRNGILEVVFDKK